MQEILFNNTKYKHGNSRYSLLKANSIERRIVYSSIGQIRVVVDSEINSVGHNVL